MRLVGDNECRLPRFLDKHTVNTTLLPIVNLIIFMACIAMSPRRRFAQRRGQRTTVTGWARCALIAFTGDAMAEGCRTNRSNRTRTTVRDSKERKIAHGAQALVTVTRERRGNAWSGAAGGDRTHDPWLRRPILYPLSYSRWGKQEVSRRIQSFCNDVYGDGCEAANSYQNTIFTTIIARSDSSVEFRVCASSRLRFF